MARNEEKQLGRLNRLWLQKEREEGRIKDVHVPRPKLATLNSVAALKKWIPSIKSEIEYYLQQSQLSHYPERKINEFHRHIEELEREYKRYLKKLRSLDPTCKHTPWKPRAYTKKRQEPISNQNTTQKLCLFTSSDHSREEEDVNVCAGPEAAGDQTSLTQVLKLHTPSTPITTQTTDPPNQDLPLCFDQSRLAVAMASSHVALAGQQQDTGTLARVLLNGLPNLSSLPLVQIAAKEATSQPSNAGTDPSKTEHVLGLGCYLSSSDEEI
ncbi:uncharacterized protein si:dkey-86e18.1 [Myxocyprinus asiaticus]|uniref:uncharacterized protein si:dkey-86e18.1 n=1 Tax=Myxocyprinus asiaticus TaxID=70543 RepID=UPI0022234B51|nr:uncharacterized protein si:dkey-86e18.1 [Myxocyprinus asiaticus]